MPFTQGSAADSEAVEHSVIASICVITVSVLESQKPCCMLKIRAVCCDADELRLAQLLLDHGQM